MLTKVNFNFKSLNGLKAHHKLLSLGEQLETSSSSSLETDQVDLCRFMYKLHFQQLLDYFWSFRPQFHMICLKNISNPISLKKANFGQLVFQLL